MSLTIIACGARDWHNSGVIWGTLDELRAREPELNVIEGRCRGADRIAGAWAARNRARGVGWVPFPARWTIFGKAAGPIRNQEMLDRLLEARDLGHEVLVVAFHDALEQSRGTKDMVRRARKAGVPVMMVTSKGLSEQGSLPGL